MESILEFAHTLLRNILDRFDNCVDMTVGNGNDTLFLASICNHVYGFDIQKQALDITNEKLKCNHFNNVSLYEDSHENINQYDLKNVKGIIFNLGYLPKGNKNITTKVSSTLIALNKSLSLLKKGGICILVIYPGHQEGLKESVEILRFTASLSQKEYQVLRYEFFNQKNNPPYLIAIQKLKEC